MSFRKFRIKKALLEWPYWLIFIIVFFGFIFLNINLNDSHFFFGNLGYYQAWFTYGFLFFTLLIAGLVGLTINLTILRFSETRNVGKRAGGISAVGIFGGILGGGCPACFVGVFPALMGFLGIGVSLVDLPLMGLEIQIVSAILLGFSVYLLSSDIACKAKLKTDNK